ncbi:MAG: helix-turn-helix domain-containing protein [Paracoccaceae bacterium]
MTINTDKVPNLPILEGLASSYPAGTIIEDHSHETHQIAHAIRGTMRVLVRDATWFVPLGRALWIPANTVHSIQCLQKVDMRTVYLPGNPSLNSTRVKVMSVSPLMREILVRLSEGCPERQIPHLKSLLLDEIAAMHVEQLQIPISADPRIARLTRHLLENPTDDISLERWATLLGFSQRNLIRRIRAQTGMTFRELKRQTRVMLAIEKLSGGQTVTGTALDVGFESTSAFIHAFRLVTGSTPRKYIS